MCELVTIAAEKDVHRLYLDVYCTVGLFKSSDNGSFLPIGLHHLAKTLGKRDDEIKRGLPVDETSRIIWEAL